MLPSAIRQSGVLTVASSIGYPPFEFYAPNGKTMEGIDIDVINAIGKELGVKVKISDTRYPDIIPTLEANRFDLAISAFYQTPAWAKYVTFVNYMSNTEVGYIVSTTNTTIKSNDPTSMCWATVGIVQGETWETPHLTVVSKTCTAEGKQPIIVKTFLQNAEVILSVESGQVTARNAIPPVGAYTAQQAPTKLKFVPNVIPAESEGLTPNGIAIPNNDAKLVTAVQAALTELVKNGTYHQIFEKWGDAENQLSKITLSK
jgi:polar amino acid transport system substrate-binding protein